VVTGGKGRAKVKAKTVFNQSYPGLPSNPDHLLEVVLIWPLVYSMFTVDLDF